MFDKCFLMPIPKFEAASVYEEEIVRVSKEIKVIYLKNEIKNLAKDIKNIDKEKEIDKIRIEISNLTSGN